ncbi:MAG: urease accessory protein UreE [Rhizobiales bacterium]|nr:urease accessory protein UreE [Hyphomicrobiales bacterium]MBA67733.1 urease accessory protein UreE [Hyphomicrobiales bacterium]|tara:strand:- start:79 stop:666 length:588 start_codon:yes stop_codon:yes gene_type:complete
MTLLKASEVRPDAEGHFATITLDETARHRRRMRMVTDRLPDGSSVEFLLDLPEARLLRQGEGLVLSDGRVIEVRAAPEDLMEVSGRDARHLLALAWQIGNRHLPAEIKDTTIRLRRDHVIRTMLEGLGATVSDVKAAFDPEGGAYDHGHAHSHGTHHHGAGHDHDHLGMRGRDSEDHRHGHSATHSDYDGDGHDD